MSVGGFFTSDSTSKQTTNSSPISASDNAVVFRLGGAANTGDRNVGNVVVKVAKDGSYVVHNTTQAGYSQEQLDNILEERQRSLALSLAGIQADEDNTGLETAVQERVEGQITGAPEADRKQSFNIGLIVFAMLALAVASIIFTKTRKKS